MKRVKIEKKSSVNPLFEKWILEWKKEATESGSDNLRFLYGKAIKSLQKYPFALTSGKECVILENFGPKLCAMIDKKLESHRKSVTEDEWSKIINPISKDPEIEEVSKPVAKKKKLDPNKTSYTLDTSGEKSTAIDVYVPKYRSGNYAILVSLFHFNNGLDSATKADIIGEAKNWCDTSFTKSQPGSFYTAWSSMGTLIRKQLVTKTGRPVKYKLTEKGLKLAKNLSSLSKEDVELFSAETPPPSPSRRKPENYQPISPLEIISHSSTDDVPSNSSQNSTSLSDIPEKLPLPRNAGAKKKKIKTNNFPSIDETSKSVSSLHPFTISSTLTKTKSVTSSLKENGTQEIQTVASSSQSSDICRTNSASITEESLESQETIFLFPNNFSIVLLVDIHETEMKGKQRNDATIQSLEKRGILCESRHLTVGDFVWIARDNLNNELVLPYIVERKRMDDLASSIKDGRFHEQKFRLRGCGLPNVIYLVEKYGHSQRLGMPLSSLQQAAMNSQVVDEFAMKVTDNHNDSILYLSTITKHLTRIFKDKTLMSCQSSPSAPDLNSDLLSLQKFKQFNKASTKNKNLTVKEMLLKQLLQLKGLSVDKALAITNRYPTVFDLINALELNGEKAIADLNYTTSRRIGPSLATTIYNFYTKHEFH